MFLLRPVYQVLACVKMLLNSYLPSVHTWNGCSCTAGLTVASAINRLDKRAIGNCVHHQQMEIQYTNKSSKKKKKKEEERRLWKREGFRRAFRSAMYENAITLVGRRQDYGCPGTPGCSKCAYVNGTGPNGVVRCWAGLLDTTKQHNLCDMSNSLGTRWTLGGIH